MFLCQTHKHTPTVSLVYLFKSEVVLTYFDQLKSAICNIRALELQDRYKIKRIVNQFPNVPTVNWIVPGLQLQCKN